MRTRKNHESGMSLIEVLVATLILVGATFMNDMVATTIGINLAALGLAAAALWIGIVDERRSAFWAGALFAVLLVVSRFFEFNSSLLLKSLAFITCGLNTFYVLVERCKIWEKHYHLTHPDEIVKY